MKKYWVFFKADIQKILEYRFDNLIYTFTNVATPLVGLGLWYAISKSSQGLPFEPNEIVMYFLLVIWVRSITFSWIEYFMEESINSGKFTLYLIKPFTALEEYVVHYLSEKLFRVGILTIVIFLLSYLILDKDQSLTSLRLENFLLFLPSLILAAVINLMIGAVIGVSTFWFHEVEFLRTYTEIFNDLFSGKLIPVVFLPSLLGTLAIYLPFRYSLSFPIEVLMGKVAGSELVTGFTIQIIWVLITVVLYKIVYSFGIKRYQGYGS